VLPPSLWARLAHDVLAQLSPSDAPDFADSVVAACALAPSAPAGDGRSRTGGDGDAPQEEGGARGAAAEKGAGDGAGGLWGAQGQAEQRASVEAGQQDSGRGSWGRDERADAAGAREGGAAIAVGAWVDHFGAELVRRMQAGAAAGGSADVKAGAAAEARAGRPGTIDVERLFHGVVRATAAPGGGARR
jgi:hypothetical protein